MGPDCQAKYGARPQFAPNPQFAEWERRQAHAIAQQRAEQQAFDRTYEDGVRVFEQNLRVWEQEQLTPPALARAEARRIARRTVVIDSGIVVSYVASELVIRLAAAAGVSFL